MQLKIIQVVVVDTDPHRVSFTASAWTPPAANSKAGPSS